MSDRTRPAAGAAVADEGTLRALELAQIIEMLAAHTSFTPSREMALATEPAGDAGEVRRLHDQTDEAARLLDEQPQAGIGGARDLR
ncbi:MAG: hypothetical protein M3295_08350, partial [Chloroflexota bacterium]|nr:hypothetical protein [Chloroflexota bacterium]